MLLHILVRDKINGEFYKARLERDKCMRKYMLPSGEKSVRV